MKRFKAFAIALPLSAVLAVTGCTAADRPSESAPLSGEGGLFTTPAASGPIDSVVWNLSTGEPASLDWLYAYADSENATLANMCEGLMRQNEDYTLGLALAEAVERPDANTLVFTIRDGVTFWDGSPLTADDVVFSLARHLDAEAGSYWGVPFYDSLESIDKTGELEVTIKFSQPDALFESMLATAAGIIGSKAFVEQAGDAYGTASGGIMCTGPFEFDSWRSGTNITMVKNANYWDQSLVPLTDKLTLTFVTDEATIMNSLTSGDIDGTYRTPLSATEPLMASNKGNFYRGASTDWLAFRPTEKDGPMQNSVIRQALSLALDRDAVAKTVFRGTAVSSLTPIQPGAWGYSQGLWEAANKNLTQPKFDIDAAKKLISDNQLEGESLRIAIPAELEAEVKTAEVLVSGAKKIGLDVEIVQLPVTTFTGLYFDAAARADFDAFLVTEYGAGVADPIVSMSEFTPLSAYNYGLYDDPTVTGGVEDAFQAIDDDARADYLIKAQERMVEDLPLINVVNPEMRLFMNERITGATASSAFLYYPWAAAIGAAS